MSWFKDLFIDEAKAALKSKSGVSDDQVKTAVNAYLEENPVSSATARVEDGVLKIT